MISLMRRLVSLQRNCSGENLARSVVRPYIRILIAEKSALIKEELNTLSENVRELQEGQAAAAKKPGEAKQAGAKKKIATNLENFCRRYRI